MPVTIQIAASCIVTASDLDFGSYDAASATPARAQGGIQLQCAPGLVAELSLDGGTAPGADTSRRKMGSEAGGIRLDYGLFQDSGRTIHWGDTPGVDTLELVTTGAPQAVPVYGEVPAGQRTPAGTYGDVITVRVLF